MKTARKILISLLAGICGLAAGALARGDPSVKDAIQAIQQAQDPSAAIAAYANGFAVDRNNPELYSAFVSRMVDLGLPELAYHQAQTLTTLHSNNGLAWGVVAYVDARRGQMPEAVSAINLAGQFDPENKFVQHTAGELVAWYDLRADKQQVSESAKTGLAKVRSLLETRPAFTEAYSAAQKAYQSGNAQSSPQGAQSPPLSGASQAPQASASSQTQVSQSSEPSVYTAPFVPQDYYPDYGSYDPGNADVYMDWGPSYCYGWGPGWVAPAPWWWWQPCGLWNGCNFFPFCVSFAFGDFDDFHHFDHDRFFDRDGRFGHHHHPDGGGFFAHRGDPSFWHHGATQGSFFGAPARPNAAVTQWARTGVESRPTAGTAPMFVNRNMVSPRTSIASRSFTDAPAARAWGRPGSVYSVPRPTRNALTGVPYAGRSLVPRSSGAGPSYRAPSYVARRFAAPARTWSGGYSGWNSSPQRSFGGNSFASTFHGGGFSGGGFHGGGGFHAGGFSGGGSHGGRR